MNSLLKEKTQSFKYCIPKMVYLIDALSKHFSVVKF